MALGRLSLPVAAARAIALAGLALVACAALTAALLLGRPRRQDPTAAIPSRYGSLVVPVSRVWQQPGVAVIDVADMDALARIAVHYERSILHERTEYGDAFWVSDESGQFRYAVLDPLWEAPAEEQDQWADDGAARETWTEDPAPPPLEPHGWAPAPAPPEEIAAGEEREALPAETLRFGAVSPSALRPASQT